MCCLHIVEFASCSFKNFSSYDPLLCQNDTLVRRLISVTQMLGCLLIWHIRSAKFMWFSQRWNQVDMSSSPKHAISHILLSSHRICTGIYVLCSIKQIAFLWISACGLLVACSTYKISFPFILYSVRHFFCGFKQFFCLWCTSIYKFFMYCTDFQGTSIESHNKFIFRLKKFIFIIVIEDQNLDGFYILWYEWVSVSHVVLLNELL